MNQPLEFAWYWILPNVRAHNRRKLFPAFFGSNPFPCEGEIRAMAEAGVNVISTMDDIDYKNKTVTVKGLGRENTARYKGARFGCTVE